MRPLPGIGLRAGRCRLDWHTSGLTKCRMDRRGNRSVLSQPFGRVHAPLERMPDGRDTDPGNAVAVLESEHRTVERLFVAFERTAEGDLDAARTMVRRACEELTIHAMIELELLYDPLAKAGCLATLMQDGGRADRCLPIPRNPPTGRRAGAQLRRQRRQVVDRAWHQCSGEDRGNCTDLSISRRAAEAAGCVRLASRREFHAQTGRSGAQQSDSCGHARTKGGRPREVPLESKVSILVEAARLNNGVTG
jgi:hypothetical protein